MGEKERKTRSQDQHDYHQIEGKYKIDIMRTRTGTWKCQYRTQNYSQSWKWTRMVMGNGKEGFSLKYSTLPYLLTLATHASTTTRSNSITTIPSWSTLPSPLPRHYHHHYCHHHKDFCRHLHQHHYSLTSVKMSPALVCTSAITAKMWPKPGFWTST